MEKAYNVSELKFEKEYLLLVVDNQLIKIKLIDVSDKLANATDQEKKDYKITPSGYGIHWRLLDEDLSINGLLKVAKSKDYSHK